MKQINIINIIQINNTINKKGFKIDIYKIIRMIIYFVIILERLY